MNIYSLMRRWWDWAYKNPTKVKPIHSALYFLMIDHCNRMGWKREVGFPTVMAMDALGVSHFNTYSKALNDLVEFGYVVMLEKSRNQYSANIIALSYFDEAYDKAHDEPLDVALSAHATKQSSGIMHSTVSIDIQDYNTTNTTKRQTDKEAYTPDFETAWIAYGCHGGKKKAYAVWKKLPIEERTKAVEAIPMYLSSIEPKYKKYFEGYLNSGLYESTFTPQHNGQAPQSGTPLYHNLL